MALTTIIWGGYCQACITGQRGEEQPRQCHGHHHEACAPCHPIGKSNVREGAPPQESCRQSWAYNPGPSSFLSYTLLAPAAGSFLKDRILHSDQHPLDEDLGDKCLSEVSAKEHKSVPSNESVCFL